ncbi:hypothetical protein CA3LBN_002295 [Candidozyma haemuli]|uniref:Uncharacterized protein n=1 Tax=Candidozyma haemuli TaxID=45357 RepID=A0ABX8I5V3_9ASCO|nr:hypothetical protein CA3LBN_002295 [[Candida] haemuloni]
MLFLLFATAALAARFEDCTDCSVITTAESLAGTITYTGPTEVPETTSSKTRQSTTHDETTSAETTQDAPTQAEPTTDQAPETPVTQAPATTSTTATWSDSGPITEAPLSSDWIVSTITVIVPSSSVETVTQCHPSVVSKTEVVTLSTTSSVTNLHTEEAPDACTAVVKRGFDFRNGSYTKVTQSCSGTAHATVKAAVTVVVSSWLETSVEVSTTSSCEEAASTITGSEVITTETTLTVPNPSGPGVPPKESSSNEESTGTHVTPKSPGQSTPVSSEFAESVTSESGTPSCAATTVTVTEPGICAFANGVDLPVPSIATSLFATFFLLAFF